MKKSFLLKSKESGEAVSFFKLGFLFFMLLISINLSAQIDVSIDQLRNMPESQLLQYYNAAKSQGYSTEQLIELARLKGASPTELMELRRRINELEAPKKSDDSMDQKDFDFNSENVFGIQQSDTLDISYSPVYGADFFNNPKVQFTPSMNLATPSSYQLGPGDTIVIELYGASASTYVKEISSSGTVSIQGVAPIYLSGYTLRSAKKKLINSLSTIYQGLISEDPSVKVTLEVNLQSARTILVQVVGQVNTPGTYALSGFSNSIHALYAAGGIQFNGSYRNIELKRAGKTIEQIDLYEFFTSGKYSLRLLRDGDVLFVPYYQNRVEVMGAVKKRGLFEPSKGETLSQFIQHFGGFLPSADPTKITIDRMVGTTRNLVSVLSEDFDNQVLQNGDRITALERFPSYENKVTLQGSVVAPGEFSLEKAPTIQSLLSLAGGLQQNAISAFATIYREQDGLEREVKSIDLTSQEDLSTPLRSGDRIVVYDQNDLEVKGQINVQGAVKEPGQFPFYSGITLNEAIALSKGIIQDGDDSNIAVYRNTKTLDGLSSYELKSTGKFSILSTQNSLELSPLDVIVVGQDPRKIEPEFIEIAGQVKNPGTYLLDQVNGSLEELISLAGLNSKASTSGIYILRSLNQKEQISGSKKLEVTLQELNENTANIQSNFGQGKATQQNIVKKEKDQPNLIKIPVVLGKKNNQNPTLEKGDIVIVERTNNNVEIKGAVNQPTATSFNSSKISAKAYIKAAGGFSETALKKRVFAVDQNGSIRSTSKFLIFNIYPRVSPGGVVVVPERSGERNRASFQELMGVATSLATFGIIIDRLFQ